MVFVDRHGVAHRLREGAWWLGSDGTWCLVAECGRTVEPVADGADVDWCDICCEVISQTRA